MTLSIERQITEALVNLADAQVAKDRARFFKTGPGEYGEGDKFRGLTVPQIRSIEKDFRKRVTLEEAVNVLSSEHHEDRLLALLLMNYLYKTGDEQQKKKVYDAYLANTKFVNNWDLVDSSARFIVGPQAESTSRQILYTLAASPEMWERRIGIVATYHLIKKGDLGDTFNLAELLMEDEHDLIQKAVGWMLREAGKMDEDALVDFLERFASVMPRTMLRYSLEKFPKDVRDVYMAMRKEGGQ